MLFITAGAITKLFAWGVGDSGTVEDMYYEIRLRRVLCGLVCPSCSGYSKWVHDGRLSVVSARTNKRHHRHVIGNSYKGYQRLF
jgi:hypothetical protein